MTDMASAGEVPAGIDYPSVARYLAEHVPGADGPLTVELIAGGRSNLTYALSTPAGSWILRRPPLGHVLPTAHDMSREYRVLAALADTDVPVPRPLALCEDAGITGAPFYLMERAYGIVAAEEMPDGWATTPTERQVMADALVETLARLHAIDPAGVGLADFGRPEGFLARQVRRWGEQWDRSKTADVAVVERVRERLAATVPDSPPAAIVHGDFRLGNLMFAQDDPGRVVAVFDWEMSTVGDPLADLAWTLATWVRPGDPPGWIAGIAPALPTLAPGFPSREELVAAYAERVHVPVKHVDWYTAFGLYKLAVIREGIYARFLNGQTVGEGFEAYGGSAEALCEVAAELLGSA